MHGLSRITDGEKLRLRDFDPSDTLVLESDAKLSRPERHRDHQIFVDLSKDKQRRRFLERVEMPEKNWKFSKSDVAEREYWHEYQSAYEEVIRNTATRGCPWYVVPADNKWFARVVVAAAILDALASLDLAYPKVDKERRREIADVYRT